MTSTTKNIIMFQKPHYMTKNIGRIIMKNPLFKHPPTIFLKCQTTKCQKEFMNYMKSLIKTKNFGKIMEKGSQKEIKEMTGKIRKSKEYKASVKCLIENCYDKYISDMIQSDKNIPKMKLYCKELISVYNETIKEVESVKVDDKLVRALNKHKLKQLHNMSKKDIHSMYKSFINSYKESRTNVKKLCKKYEKIEKILPLYDKLLNEDKKEEYIFTRTFQMY